MSVGVAGSSQLIYTAREKEGKEKNERGKKWMLDWGKKLNGAKTD